ncbi:MAG TPA: hypothetical protein VN428_08065 [Bryobacteraceae bacterium]|nr:hypothetical protein [Bryobacteraceae bacterium]
MRAFVCSMLLALAAAFAQQSLPLDPLPPNTVAIIGVNLAALRGSAIGQSIMAELKEDKRLPEKARDAIAGIDEILIARPSGRNQRQNGLVLMKMSCREDSMTVLLGDRQPTVSSWSGTRVMTVIREGQPFSIACLKPDIVAGGDPESLKWALGRRIGGRTLSPDLASAAAVLRSSHDIWLVANANMSELASQLPQQQAAALAKAPLVQAIRQISGGAKLSNGINIAMNITAKTAQDAETMAGGMMMFAGMLKSNPKQAKQYAPLLESLNIAAHGETMEMSLHLTEQQLAAISSQVRSRPGASAVAATPVRQPQATGEIKVYSSEKDMGVVTLP